MNRIRVLIVDMPAILSGVIRHTLEDHEDMVVVGELSDVSALAERIAVTSADVVLLDASHVPCGDGWPSVALLALTPDAREAWCVKPLGELSPDALADAVRSVATTA